MKYIIILLALMMNISVNAQREVETTVPVTKGQDVFLHFKFAENIKIEHWNKSEVLVKVKAIIDNGYGDEALTLKTNKSGSEVEIYSDFGDYFKRKWSDRNRHNNNSHTEILYTVYLPANIDLRVKSISGSVEAENFKGQLKTELVSGDITIKGYDGELWLKTVSGDVDVTIDRAEVNAQTVSGTIYSNLDIDQDGNGKRNRGRNKIIGTINSGGNLVKMQTVSGDIYMRKS